MNARRLDSSLAIPCRLNFQKKARVSVSASFHAGWPAILLTWAWALVIWQIADFVKFLASWNMQIAEEMSAQCKETGERRPTWVKMIDVPGAVGDQISDAVDKTIQVRLLLGFI